MGEGVSQPGHLKRISGEGEEGERERVCVQRQGRAGEQSRVRKKLNQVVQSWENETGITKHCYLAGEKGNGVQSNCSTVRLTS